jgi:hypothetical protein
VLNPVGVAVLCLVISQQPGAAPAPAVIPMAARQLLEGNAKEIDGLEFNIAIENRFLAKASPLPAELQSLGEDLPAPEVDIVRISGARFYEKAIHGLKNTQVGELTYNGRVLYIGRPPDSESESMLTIDTVDRCLAEAKQTGFPRQHFFWNYFREAGYHLPEFPSELGETSSSVVLHLAKLGRVISWVDNATTGMHEVVLEAPDPWSLNMTPQQIKDAVSSLLGESKQFQEGVLRRLVERSKSEPFRRYRFSLDPALGFAVREKWETTSKGVLLSHTACEEFSKVQDRNVWLPKVCRVLIYVSERFPSYNSKTPLYEITANLKGAVPKAFSDKDFELWYEAPGGWVIDRSSPKATANKPVVYNVPGSASSLANASKGALGISKTTWLIILNGAILVSILFFIIRRRVAFRSS